MSVASDNPVIEALGRPLRLGVVGGGAGSFIGPIHRSAATLDGRFAIVAGVLSSDPARAIAQGRAIGLAAERAYPTLEAMIAGETRRDDGIETVAIMTPNDAHYAACCAAIQAGWQVICDKPLVNTLDDARDLAERAKRAGTIFCVTHNYSGYPLIRQARAMIREGAIGAVRIVQAEYLQGGMSQPVERGELTPKLRWKLDPKRSGPSLVLGDIGTHAHHLAGFVSGQLVSAVAADVGSLLPERRVDDYAALLWRFANGARGTCLVSQAAAGAENDLTVRVCGESGLIEWHHAAPNYLRYARFGEPVQTLARGDPYLHPAASRVTRITRGHPEGFRESFAALYADAAEAIAARLVGSVPDPLALDFPTVDDGVRGVAFVDAVRRSASREGQWQALDSE